MAKAVFRPSEIVSLTSPFSIGGEGKEQEGEERPEVLAPLEEYTGPSVDDLKREAEEFKAQFDRERETMIASANAEVQEILRRAEATAFEEVKRKSDQAQKARREAEEEAGRIIQRAETRVRELEAEAHSKLDAVEKEAFKKGFEQGREDGFKEGKAEVERLVGRIHVILEKAMDKRGEILEQTEAQVVELVLLLAKKVVKVISENQKNVVISNIAQALKKLKTKSDVIIRVNLADLQLASEHAKDFIAQAENAKRVTIVEDTTIDRGGCIVETDFGEIDARIASQLHELEEKILDISPIKAKGKAQG
ncbi:MAG: flagellar assembly protein FliH [Spirochaetes bacterium]|nr:flagellar assembly protein FliH [Spirochaetota bacterium]